MVLTLHKNIHIDSIHRRCVRVCARPDQILVFRVSNVLVLVVSSVRHCHLVSLPKINNVQNVQSRQVQVIRRIRTSLLDIFHDLFHKRCFFFVCVTFMYCTYSILLLLRKMPRWYSVPLCVSKSPETPEKMVKVSIYF